MKTLILVISILSISFSSFTDDESCKVLVPALQGNYEGGCKKGLANGSGKATGIDTYEGEFKNGLPEGKGTYTWANGDVFDGEFKKGKPDGAGTLTRKSGEIEKGYWRFGFYTGETKNAPLYKINRKQYINNSSVQRVGDGNKVSFIWQWGSKTLYTADALQMTASSGIESSQSNFTGYNDIIFPFNSHLEFDATDKAGTFSYHCIFDFELLIPGEYVIKFDF